MERLVQSRIGNHMYCIHSCMDIHVICDYTREISSAMETVLVYYIIAAKKMSGLDSLLHHVGHLYNLLGRTRQMNVKYMSNK